jgi:hypothetical protein
LLQPNVVERIKMKNFNGSESGTSIKSKLVARLAVLLLTIAASADGAAVYINGTPSVGHQFGGPYVLGMDFQVNVPVTVGQIGAFDSGQDGFTAPVSVEIYDLTHGTWVGGDSHSTRMTFSVGDDGTLVGGSRFKDLSAPVTLPIGTYSIVAANYGTGVEVDGNVVHGDHFMSFDDQGGKLTFINNARYSGGSSLVLPTTIYNNPNASEPAFAAGTFALVPEPYEYGLAAVLGSLVLAMQKLRRKTA